MLFDEKDLVERAMRAYFDSGGGPQPSNTSALEHLNGRDYVVLRNINGVLAVYQLNDESRLLTRVADPPAELTA